MDAPGLAALIAGLVTGGILSVACALYWLNESNRIVCLALLWSVDSDDDDATSGRVRAGALSA